MNNIVTPWEVNGSVDYEKVVKDFGADLIKNDLVQLIQIKTGKRAHRFLRRGIFFAHRDLDRLLYSNKEFYLYTGRGPSSSNLHFGHLVPLLFTQYLQEVFDVPLVFQLTDDEKFLFKDLTLEQANQYARENAKDILALGFNPEKTFLFQNTQYVDALYPTVLSIQRQINENTMQKVFGFTKEDSIGKWAFPPMQIAPCFSSSFPGILKDNMQCLIPCAIDQEPYFRLARTIAPPLKQEKPTIIASKFFPALQGVDSKMSSTSKVLNRAEKVSTIFLTDTPEQIKSNIRKFAFSGGQDSKEKHILIGANLDVDVPFQWLTFFLEDDDELEEIKQKYKKGELFTSQVKERLAEVLIQFAEEHAKRRAQVTEEQLNFVMSRRSIL